MNEPTCIQCRAAVRSETCVSCGPPRIPPIFDAPNPALELHRKAFADPGPRYRTSFEYRDQCINKYTFAVPNDQTLAYIASHGPVVEIGAGLGYWAYLLQSRFGCDVLAFDIAPIGVLRNKYWKENAVTWFDVHQGTPDMASKFPERSLFLCWPPYDTPMAAHALMAYSGDNVFYVGEGHGGCTGDNRFHEMLAEHWDLIEVVAVPQWYAVNDNLYHYRRRRPATQETSDFR